jgi:diguanylate cyclase (GGDEF)-like protein
MLRKFYSPPTQLPDEVYGELVDMMFTAIAPIIVMGVATTALVILLASEADGILFPALAAACLCTTASRVGIMMLYRQRRVDHPLAPSEIRLWERRYALSSYTFAILLGLVNALSLMSSDVLVHMLVTGLIFGYGAGLATRIAVRPAISSISLLLAVVPTLAGLVTHVDDDGARGAMIYLGQALLIASFTAAGLETVFHVYRTTLRQLLAKLDLSRLARRDALTGLPNRLLLRDQFEVSVGRIRSTGHFAALLVLDLDRFKPVNDQFGHVTGDALLQAVAKRIRSVVAEQDTVARVGGDEFVVVQTGIQHEDEANILAHRIIRVVSAPYQLGEYKVQIGVSVGVAIAPRDGLELEKLVLCADAALYSAKREGRGRVSVWHGPSPEQVMPLAI